MLCTKIGNFSVSYKSGWLFISKQLALCTEFTVSGSAGYTLWLKEITSGSEYIWTNQKLTGPTLHAKLHAYSAHFRDCAGSKAATKEKMGQHWTGYSCSFNPSLSFAAPWSVGISVWPTCGTRKQASYKTSYGRGSSYTQYNSGSPTGFGYFVSNLNKFNPPCYGVFVSAVLWEGNVSDSFGAGNSPHVARVCLSKK